MRALRTAAVLILIYGLGVILNAAAYADVWGAWAKHHEYIKGLAESVW